MRELNRSSGFRDFQLFVYIRWPKALTSSPVAVAASSLTIVERSEHVFATRTLGYGEVSFTRCWRTG